MYKENNVCCGVGLRKKLEGNNLIGVVQLGNKSMKRTAASD
jgi:hypothetical protein